MNSRNDKAEIRIYYCRNAASANEMPAALSKLQLHSEVALEAVPCGGKIDPRYLLKAFEGGARAVCVLACPNGHCRLMEGNLRAISRTRAVAELLAEAGLDPDSVRIHVPHSPELDTLDAAMTAMRETAGVGAQPAVGVSVQ